MQVAGWIGHMRLPLVDGAANGLVALVQPLLLHLGAEQAVVERGLRAAEARPLPRGRAVQVVDVEDAAQVVRARLPVLGQLGRRGRRRRAHEAQRLREQGGPVRLAT